MRSNSATSMEEPDGNQTILDAFENHNAAKKVSPNQFTQLVHLLKHIQEGKPVGSEVNVNSVAGIFSEHSSSCYSVDNSNSKYWTIDSGASEHMFFDPNSFLSLIPLPEPLMIRLPDSSRVKGPFLKNPHVLGEVKD
ncbi:hypothetical protein H5410_003823 [Solanum commersonii]|uniref:Uncharacterized protein n=1 Tax=Solanum commersonii TaxID=4109 RepID=A0A9J6B674_SOLCO|nr:hypothetical protein H5410_003823 [Solanum commersonii]